MASNQATDGNGGSDFSHYAVIADGEIVEADPTRGLFIGPSVMSVKIWARDTDEAADMIIALANQMNFKIADRIEIYETEPDRAPEDRPFGYDLNFTPYDPEAEEE
jgi:hypothetical protein